MNTLTSTSSFLRPAVVRGRVCVVAVLLLLMARPSLTFAQSVTATVAGIVVDARTRQPLVGGLVALGRPPQSMPTDTEGRFRFEAFLWELRSSWCRWWDLPLKSRRS